MNTKSKHCYDFLKGAFVGLGCIIPGMSGGTAAMCIGIYERLLKDCAGILNTPLKSIKDAVIIVCGAASAVFLSAKPIAAFHSSHMVFANLIFCAITGFSTLFFIKNSFKSPYNPRMLICTSIGMLLAFIISALTDSTNSNAYIKNPFFLALIGCVLALALVLPGISFSYMLLYFGIYDKTLNAVHTFDYLFLLPLLLGIFIGTYVFAKLFLKIIDKHSTHAYCVILGFIMYSLSDILSKSLNC